MNHKDKMRKRIGENAGDAQTMRDFEQELRAKGNHTAADKVAKKGREYDGEAAFLRDRLHNL